MNYLTIKLTRGYEAKIDYEDQHLVGELWYALHSGSTPPKVYAAKRGPNHSAILLHREIMNAGPEDVVDHRNGDTLDNRRGNLRKTDSATNRINVAGPRRDNKCGFLGVYPKGKRWGAHIQWRGKRTHLGTFDTPEEAHEARLEAERRIHGVQPQREHLHG